MCSSDLIAHDVFNVPTRITRMRSPEIKQSEALLGADGFAVDRVICLEDSVTRYIHQLVDVADGAGVARRRAGRDVYQQGRA